MKTVKFTAEEIRILDIYLTTNPCEAGCALDHMPRLPKNSSGVYDCYAEKDNGQYICPLQRANWNIREKLGLI